MTSASESTAAGPARARLDNRGSLCAVGLIRAQRLMRDLPAGGRLEILTADKFAPTEVRLWAERDGYVLEDIRRRGVWPFRHYRFVLAKPGAAAAAPATADDSEDRSPS